MTATPPFTQTRLATADSANNLSSDNRVAGCFEDVQRPRARSEMLIRVTAVVEPGHVRDSETGFLSGQDRVR